MNATMTKERVVHEPMELLAELERSGTGERALRHMMAMLDETPGMTIDDLVTALHEQLKEKRYRCEAAVVGQGTLDKIPFILEGKPIPVDQSRMSSSMFGAARATLAAQPQLAATPPPPPSIVGPVSKSDPIKAPVQPIGPVETKSQHPAQPRDGKK